jgi:UDP-N-acetylmuramate: L-alanyl-gamma-D-glutamyl-meso-diaminopimelate ligase
MRIHLIGVGGAAMGNLAAMLQKSGHRVSGSDENLYPPMSHRLKDWKIDARPFDREAVKKKDLVIVGNAISRGNVELEEALARGLQITSMAAAMQEFFLKGRQAIVVAGTHGKTTTSFLIDYILSQNARKKNGQYKKSKLPGLFVGGVRADGHPGFRMPGKDCPYFVIEGDEYDTAFFDKASKFLHYRPVHLILTSVEFDHADIFSDFDVYKKSFRILLRWIPRSGSLVACMDDEGVREVCDGYSFSRLFRYGSSADHSHAIRQGDQVNFRILDPKVGSFADYSCRPALIGEHNTYNALAAIHVARELGLKEGQILRGLETFPGVIRRQQLRVDGRTNGGHCFMEDFAHHPTAVQKTLAAVREAYPGHRIIALYEPRSATSHRNLFAKEYAGALAAADLVLLPDVFNRDKVPLDQRLDVPAMVQAINDGGTRARYCGDAEGVWNALRNHWPELAATGGPIMVLAMSNGAFGGIYNRIDGLVSGTAQ